MSSTNDIQWPAWQDVPHAVTARNEERLLVAVDVEPQATAVAGQHTPHGLQFRIIYKSQLKAVQAQVRTDAERQRMQMAQEQWRHEFTQHAKTNHRGDEKLALETFGPSPQMFYEALPGGKGGIAPLLSLAVHPDVIPAPHTPESAAEQQSSALVKALQEVVRAGQRNDQNKR